jgi:hypothetical protein
MREISEAMKHLNEGLRRQKLGMTSSQTLIEQQ